MTYDNFWGIIESTCHSDPRSAEGIDAEAEIYAAAHRAWMQVTGKSDTDDYPARNESADLNGENWDFDDPELMRQHLPQLKALYRDK